MADVLKLLHLLSQFYDRDLKVSQVEEIFKMADVLKLLHLLSTEDSSKCKSIEADDGIIKDVDEETGNAADDSRYIENISVVKIATNDSQVLSILLELCTALRNRRKSNMCYDNTFDCWDRAIIVSPKEGYLPFIYALLKLANYDPTRKSYRQLSIASARAYFLSLTIPGSKEFHIFDEQVTKQAIEIFDLVDLIQDLDISSKISKQERIEIWVNLSNLCDDIKILFRYVHFDEYINIRNSILKQLTKLLYNNHVNGYENIYAANLHSKCFEIFEEVTSAHNGDPEDILMKIMRIPYCLHGFPPLPKPNDNFSIDSKQFCQHISDWFVTITSKYPRPATKVLQLYIKCIITNPEKNMHGEQLHHALDYAAKYDTNLHTKCNESIVPFLCTAANADDIQIRTRAVEMFNHMLLMESKVKWEVFTHEISKIPREVHIIKELIHRMMDIKNAIKLRAIYGLRQAFLKGSQNTTEILTEGIRFANFEDDNVDLPIEPRLRFGEIRYEQPKSLKLAYIHESHKLIQPYFCKLPSILYHLLDNPFPHIRRASLILIENIVLLNPCIVYKTRFVQECSKIGNDSTPLVRNQALLMIDSVLDRYPNCYPIVCTWCKIIVPLFKDSDQKIVEQAMECFKRRVFDNIVGVDRSNKAEHFMPWVIIRILFVTQPRQFLQSHISSAIRTNTVDQRTFSIIESHTLTSNSTEAWIMLSFAGKNIKMKDPDSLITLFIKSMADKSLNICQNLQIILEILCKWINEFSNASLNMAFSCIMDYFKTGNIPPNVVSKAFNFCHAIHNKSNNQNNIAESSQNSLKISNRKGEVKRIKEHVQWIEDIHNIAEEFLLHNLNNFDTERTIILSYLFTYTEANLELLLRPKKQIISQVHRYLRDYISLSNDSLNSDDIIALNQMIIIAGRFTIREASIVKETGTLYRLMLQKTDRLSTVNNIIVCITDLCQMHMQIVELVLGEILSKLKSEHFEVRLVTFNSLAQIILQDFLKLRDNLLLTFLATLFDTNLEISNRATEFFMEYLQKKNSVLFQNCLLECPFIFNEYLNFDGFESFESFAPTEMEFQSMLKGPECIKSRQQLYQIFMTDLEEVQLLMYFGILAILNDQIAKKRIVRSEEGIAMIKDMLFILKEICDITWEKSNTKCSQNNDSVEANDDNIENEAAVNNEATASSTGIKNASQTKGKVRDAMPTMNDAIKLIENMICIISKLSKILLKWDSTFTEIIGDLCISICIRFENMIKLGQPIQFWLKYRRAAKILNEKRKREAENNGRSNK